MRNHSGFLCCNKILPFYIMLLSRVQTICISFVILVLSLFVFSSCDKDDDNDNKGTKRFSRTVLLYMVAENSLNDWASADINEALSGVGCLSDDDALIIFIDDEKLPRIYEVNSRTKVSDFSKLVPVYEFDADFNSASAESLREVLVYMNKKYPSNSSGIIFWSHASGWIPSNNLFSRASLRRSFGIDNGNNSFSNRGHEMNMSDMANVLEEFDRFEFLLFDACFMQCIESAYELRNCTNYVIASPAEIPGPGANYGSSLLKSVFANNVNASAIVDAYYNHYENSRDYGVVLSAIDCREMDEFAMLMSDVMTKYSDVILEADFENVQKYFNYDDWSRLSEFPDYYDIRGVMQSVLTSEEYSEWNEAFMKLVPYAKSTSRWYSSYFNGYLPVDKEQFGGVSMFVPLRKYANETFYSYFFTTDWAKTVGFAFSE